MRKKLLIAVCILCAGNFLLAQERKSTAGKNVQVVDTAFFIPQLNRYRRVWIYLPASYNSSKQKYPVIYLQDGQNIFDDKTSFAGEWGIDEAMDTLGKRVGETIVIAIDNGGEKRLSEYAPFDFAIPSSENAATRQTIKSEGDQYVNFLVKDLMPFINKRYRTKKCRRHTAIAGSSMGALISFYALVTYPKKFGSAGVFSPSFWAAPELKNEIIKRGKKVKGKIYLYAGKMEGEGMVTGILDMFNTLHQHTKTKTTTVIRAEGKHHELSWREEFPVFYRWLRQ